MASLYWEKAAYEEAEHAAKFAELLGTELEPNMTVSTQKNLAWRVDCEFGATQGKFDLAACAKKNGLDAIHDTVHEMARDEARHKVSLLILQRTSIAHKTLRFLCGPGAKNSYALTDPKGFGAFVEKAP